jgi:acetyl-CoA carboxylase alpha subunit
MELAERFNLPVISFVDTPAAYPGVGSEERGVAEAIARSTEKCLMLKAPMVAIVTGEGGSGGALGIACGNRVLILEHAIYSVIPPEGANSILWRGARTAEEAARSVGGRNLAARLPEHAMPAEIRPLVHAFNGVLQRLEQSFQEQERFIANAAHELKTPLALARARMALLAATAQVLRNALGVLGVSAPESMHREAPAAEGSLA